MSSTLPLVLNPKIEYNTYRYPNFFAIAMTTGVQPYVINNVIDVQIYNNNYYEADTFELTFMLSTQQKGYGLAFWASVPFVLIEFHVSMTSTAVIDANERANTPLVFAGKSDKVVIDLEQGTVKVHGRDFTSLFIDSQLTVSLAGSAGQFFTSVAASMGFGASNIHVDSSLNAIQISSVTPHQKLTKRYKSAWDILTYLVNALPEPYYIYVEGYDFIITPIANTQQSTYNLTWDISTERYVSPIANMERLTVERDFILGQTVAVLVYSPSLADPLSTKPILGKASTAPVAVTNVPAPPGTAPSSTDQSINIQQAVRTYVYSAPGLTADQANIMAQAYLNQITQHVMTLTAVMPGDYRIQPYGTVTLNGTNSDWDRIYYIQDVQWDYGMDSGLRMTVTAKTTPAMNIMSTSALT